MSIDADVYATLDGILDLYPMALPLGVTLPAVTYQRVSTLRDRSHDGTSLIGPLYQFTCWDRTAKGAREIARDVIAVWEPLIDRAQIQNTYESFDPAQKLYGVRVDVRVWAHDEDGELLGTASS